MKTTLKTLICAAICCAAGSVFAAPPPTPTPCPYECSGSHSDSVAPADKTIPVVAGDSDSYTVTVTSPNCISCDGMVALFGGGVDETVSFTANTWPATSSEAEAESLISFTGTPLHVTDLEQENMFDVNVTTIATTTPGDYTYSIGGAGVDGYAWGVFATNLTVTVSEPTGGDTTPPLVTYASGCPGSYTFGESFAVQIDANDAESFVTAFDATLNGDPFGTATGLGTNSASIVVDPYTPTQIGTYALSATATSEGGTSLPATCEFTVSYDFTWLPPISLGKTSKGGSTMPIKFTIRDADGNFVTDESVHVVVTEGVTEVFSAFFGTGASNVRISTTDEQYIVNFQTASGVHTYHVCVSFAGVGGEVEAGCIDFSTR